jgi:hypothetical protein
MSRLILIPLLVTMVLATLPGAMPVRTQSAPRPDTFRPPVRGRGE